MHRELEHVPIEPTAALRLARRLARAEVGSERLGGSAKPDGVSSRAASLARAQCSRRSCCWRSVWPQGVRGLLSHARGEKRLLTLGPSEVRRMMQAVEDEPNVHVRAYFWLSLLTGCRKRELLFTCWRDVDLESGLLRLPKTKNGRVHYVPLAGHARRILEALPRREGNAYVFPGRAEGVSLSVPTIDQAWRRIRETAEAPDARLPDLRRTVGSWLAQSGVSLHLIGHVLNHSSPVVTSVYARLQNESARAALERHAQSVLTAAAGSDVLTGLTKEARPRSAQEALWSEASDQPVVLGVAPDPEPDDRVAFPGAERAVSEADTCRVDRSRGVNLLEAQARVARVTPEGRVRAERSALDGDGEILKSAPEALRGDGVQRRFESRGSVWPLPCSAMASSASCSSAV